MNPSYKLLKNHITSEIKKGGNVKINNETRNICKYDDTVEMFRDADKIAKNNDYKSHYINGMKVYYDEEKYEPKE